jgi:hypothetical protein
LLIDGDRCSLFSNILPTAPVAASTSRRTLGVKFWSPQAGTISAIRFYRGAKSPNGYKAVFYSTAGAVLGSVTMAGESGPVPGWQQAVFPAPIPMAANTTYVAAYYAPSGQYADTASGLTQTASVGPLIAPAASLVGGNGVSAKGLGYPTSGYLGRNFFVDVAFSPAQRYLSVAPSPSSPTISSATRLGALVAQLTVQWSDGSPFNGTLSFGPPNFSHGSAYALDSNNNLIINPYGPGVGSAGSSPQYVTIVAAPTSNPAASVSQNVAIVVTPEQVSFSPASLTFGSQNVGTSSAAQTVTATNTGTVSFPLAVAGIIGTDPADFTETNNCPSSLAVGASCQISVSFTPSDTGTRTALVAATAADGGTFTAGLSGTGASALPPGFYVATNGNDSNPGTLAQPFATLGKCQTAMQMSVNKTCFIRGGTYSMSSGLTLGSQDKGETWTYYPPDGINSPSLTQTSAFPFFIINAGADNVTISGLTATGFQHGAHSTCGLPSAAAFVDGGENAGSGGGAVNLTITHNVLSTWDCAIVIRESSNPIVSFNQISIVSYATIACGHCTGAAAQTVWQGNVISDINAGGTLGVNAYGITFSTSANGYSSNFTATNNQVYNSATWTCYDDHGGAHIWWYNNLCVGMGNYTAFNAAALSAALPLNDVRHIGNIVDGGFNRSSTLAAPIGGLYSFVMCGDAGCGSNSDITGGLIQNNIELRGAGNAPVIAASPTVTVQNNTGNINPEQVSSVTFQGGGSGASFTHGTPNAVVATLQVNMSNTYWAFPTPPGVLSISGTNSGGFVICNLNQICQSAIGTAAGTYNDFSITATLHGMYNSPFTAAAGALTLTAN